MATEAPSPWTPPQDAFLEERHVDVREYLRMFRRRWWLALLTLAACTGAAVGLSRLQTPLYEGRTRLFVGQQAITRADLQFGAALTQTSLALVKSYSEAIKSLPVAEDVITRLGLPDDPEALLSRVSASPVGDTQIIRLTYRDPDPRKAQNVTNTFAQAFIEAISRIDRVRSGDPSSAASVPAVQVSVLEPATLPTEPVSPKPVRNGAAGFLLGGVLAWGLVLLAERLDSSVKGRHDAEEVSGLPVLSLVPRVKAKPGRLVSASGTPAGESFRVLRTAIRFMGADQPVKVLALTSPEVGDGKTTTAYNLAVAFAEAGNVTVLVEADMRKPILARQLRVNGRGLSAYLSGAAELKGLVQKSGTPNLFVVPGGPTPANPSELLGSERMGKLLRALAKEADIVILDTPPVLAVSDAVALSPMLDAVALVARAAKTGKEHIREALRILGGVGAPVLGLVLNAVTEREGYYGYGGYYRYGYGRRPQEPQAAAGLSEAIPMRPFSTRAEPAPANGTRRRAARRPARPRGPEVWES